MLSRDAGFKNVMERGGCVAGLIALATVRTGSLAQAQGGASIIPAPAALNSLSADGSAGCGMVGPNAVRWTRQGGVEVLPPTPEFRSSVFAYSISWDGRTIVGTTRGSSPRLGWRWREGTGTEMLADLDGAIDNGLASCVSGNGQFIGGQSYGAEGLEAVIWTEHGIEIMNAASDLIIQIVGLSFAGDVVVGLEVQGQAVAGFRRDSSGTIEVLAPSSGYFVPLAMSGDGEVVVGYIKSGPSKRAARWTRAGGVEALPGEFDSQGDSIAHSVSSDGRVVCGTYNTICCSYLAWIWDAHNQMRPLHDVAESQLGVTLPAFLSVRSMSADGRTFLVSLGSGAYRVLQLASPCAADVDDGSGSGGRDEIVTIDDLTAFLEWMGSGDFRADLDDGSGHGVPDAAVTVDDLIYFLNGFEAGC